MKYKVKDIKENSVEVVFNNGEILLNNEPIELDMLQVSSEKYHIIQDNKSYNLEVLDSDFKKKHFKIKVNEEVFVLDLKDELDIQLQEMGMSVANSEKMGNVTAPMPGLVLKLLVSPGDEVKKGDSLVILEAMKMENIIKSAGDGVVKSVLVSQNDAVDKNQVIIEIE